MWDFFTALLPILSNHFDNIIMRIITWCLSFILCWLYLPYEIKFELLLNPLPHLPEYSLVYLFYLVAATAFWQVFLMLLDIFGLLWQKIFQRFHIKPKP